MTTVILAEKPDQARHYADAFQTSFKKDGYIEVTDSRFFQGTAYVTWGIGHLVELKEPHEYKSEWKKWDLSSLPILPDCYKFKVQKGKEKQFKVVKSLLEQASLIIHGCDPDREGENIGRSIIQLAGASHKPIRRLWINSLEASEILKGFSQLREGRETENYYYEAQARQIGDWMIGMNASRLYTLEIQKLGIKEVFSLGRAQTPTLYLIYQRQKEIDSFVPTPFFELFADIKTDIGEFRAKYSERLDSKETVAALMNAHSIQEKFKTPAEIFKVEKQEKKQKSPKLHSLASLQKSANKQWKYSPSDVLKTAQELYEKKILSYPRTECTFITEAEFAYLKTDLPHFQSLLSFDVAYPEARREYVNNANVHEHYAVIPTKKKLTQTEIEALSERERNIYMEVLRTTAAMFAPDYVYEETKVEVDVQGLIFKKTGKVERKKGWKAIFPSLAASLQDDKELPPVSENDPAVAVVESKEGMTTPPKLFTEGDLIEVMKSAGQKGGHTLADDEEKAVLKETQGIGTGATRAEIINTLKAKEYITIKKNQTHITQKGIILCEAVTGTLLASPEMTAKWEIYLRKIGQGTGDQKTFLTNAENFVKHLIQTAPTLIQSPQLIQRVDSMKAAQAIGKCPNCQKDVLDKGKFYSCAGYKNGCSFTLPKKILGKTVSLSNIKKLLESKKSNLIKGMEGSKGKFDAHLTLNQENELKFDFPAKKIQE